MRCSSPIFKSCSIKRNFKTRQFLFAHVTLAFPVVKCGYHTCRPDGRLRLQRPTPPLQHRLSLQNASHATDLAAAGGGIAGEALYN